jgi:hypothetical protein
MAPAAVNVPPRFHGVTPSAPHHFCRQQDPGNSYSSFYRMNKCSGSTGFHYANPEQLQQVWAAGLFARPDLRIDS